MKKIPFVISVIASFATQCAVASVQTNYVEHILNQISFAEKNQPLVWPGFHPSATPSVIAFEDNDAVSAYAFNFKPGRPEWQALNINQTPVYFIQDAKPLNVDQGADKHFAEVDGQRSFIDYEKVEEVVGAENLASKFMTSRSTDYLLHESSIEKSKFNFISQSYDGFLNPTLIKLSYLEDAALTVSQQSVSAQSEEALRDAVAIHQYRNSLLTKADREFENGLEILDGTPVYIGWTSQQLSEEDYRKKSQRTGCEPLSGMTGQVGISICMLGGIQAYQSSVYGHALEKKIAGASWKETVEQQFKSISQLAVEYYHFTDNEARSMAEQAMQKASYRYDRINKLIDHFMTPYLSEMKTAVQAYQAQSGIEIRTDAELGEAISFAGMFIDNAIEKGYQVSSLDTLLQNINLDLSTESPDMPVIKNLPFMQVHLVMNWDDEIDAAKSYTSFKLSESSKMEIDGVATTVGDFVKNKKAQSFSKLLISDEHFTMPINSGGELDASEGVLKLRFESEGSPSRRGFVKSTRPLLRANG